jgi:hypothetical protein
VHQNAEAQLDRAARWLAHASMSLNDREPDARHPQDQGDRPG